MPRGPAGVPRPIATSSVNVVFYVEPQVFVPEEIVIENGIRQDARNRGYDSFANVDVTVNETHDPETYAITLITGDSRVPHDEIEAAWEWIEDHMEENISSHSVEIRAT